MRILVTFLFIITSILGYSQSYYRIPQRAFNYSLSYGPRNKNTFYSTGYGFNKNGTTASIEVGTGFVMVGLNMFSDQLLAINGNPNEIYVTGNYVYRNKKHNKYFFVSGIGKSITEENRYILKVGGDLQISYPLYLSIHFYQTNVININHFMIGGKMIIF
jgi:hypothetical protein